MSSRNVTTKDGDVLKDDTNLDQARSDQELPPHLAALTRNRRSRAAMLIALAELSKALAWPTFVLLVFVLLYQPIRESFGAIPDFLHKTTRISVEGVAFETSYGDGKAVTPEVKQALTNLDAISVGVLIRTFGTGDTFFPEKAWNDVYKGQTIRLISRGLVATKPDIRNGASGVVVYLTATGKAAAEQMYEFVAESVRGAGARQ